jgi:hypothetical protein
MTNCLVSSVGDLMKQQNRTLVFVFVFVIGVMFVVLTKTGVLKLDPQEKSVEIETEADATLPEPSQEAMGDKLEDGSQNLSDEQKIFSIVLDDMTRCFDIKNASGPGPVPVQVDALMNAIQPDMGPSLSQGDRSMSWYLKNKEGVERRLRLEISETEDGKLIRSLKYFAVDRDGLPIEMPLAPDRKDNPSDEVLNSMLKEGDVFYKEKAAYAIFSGGSRLEFIEKNGFLSEIEFQKGSRFFRCQNLKAREACQCVK